MLTRRCVCQFLLTSSSNMADPILHFLVLGHSFVTRAERSLLSISDDNFTLPRVSHQVKLQGCSGAHVYDIMPLYRHCSFFADVVILDIGTNDLLDRHVLPHTLALQVFDIARRLSSYAGIKHVIILEALPRTTWGKYGAPVSFSHKVSQYNSKLKKPSVPVQTNCTCHILVPQRHSFQNRNLHFRRCTSQLGGPSEIYQICWPCHPQDKSHFQIHFLLTFLNFI